MTPRVDRKACRACCLLSVWLALGACSSEGRGQVQQRPAGHLPYSVRLSPKGTDYVLHWGYTDHRITFEAHVRTHGWVGFGLAPNRNMLGADLVIGWVDDSSQQAHLQDRHSSSFSLPELDKSQDWTLEAGRQNDSHTILRFSRDLVTCDPDDNEIRNDTMGVIWAYHPADPDLAPGSAPLYHGRGRRGGRSLLLMTHSANTRDAPPMPRDAFSIDFNMPNVLLPGRDTAYLCHAFPAPRLGRKHHVIQVEPILQRPHSGLVHHMILYGCYHDVDMTTVNTPTECYQYNISPTLTLCNAVYAGWAIGGESFRLPQYAGLPLGDSHYPSMMMLEIHYDNVNQRADLRDSSGVRLWLTTRLREHDAAFIQTGVTVDGFQAIPPSSMSFTSQGHCLPECLTQVMKDQPEGIHVFGALLHTHLAGIAVRVRHFRNGRELPVLIADEHYDFNYQETRMMAQEVIVLPGDHIVTECTYRTGSRFLWGGLSTREEMCIAYLLYYPAIPLTNCDSRPTRTSALSFLDVQFARGGEVMWPKELQGQTYREVLSRLEWDDNRRAAFQQSITTGQVLTSCKMGSLEYPANYKKTDIPKMEARRMTEDFDVCATRHQSEIASGGTMTKYTISIICLSLVTIFMPLHG